MRDCQDDKSAKTRIRQGDVLRSIDSKYVAVVRRINTMLSAELMIWRMDSRGMIANPQFFTSAIPTRCFAEGRCGWVPASRCETIHVRLYMSTLGFDVP